MKFQLRILFILPFLFIVFPQLALAGKSIIKDEVLHIPNIDIEGFGPSDITFDINFKANQYLFTLISFTQADLNTESSGVFDSEKFILQVNEIELANGERYSVKLSLLSQDADVVFKLDEAVLLDNQVPPEEAAADSVAMYSQQCAGCHGLSGEGVNAPPLVDCEECADIELLPLYIQRTMPLGQIDDCDTDCSLLMAEYILTAFNQDKQPGSENPEAEETTPAIAVVPNDPEPLDPETPPVEETTPVIAVVPDDPEPLDPETPSVEETSPVIAVVPDDPEPLDPETPPVEETTPVIAVVPDDPEPLDPETPPVEETTPVIVVVPNNQEPLDPDTPPDEESVPVIAVVPTDPEPLYVYIPPSGPADIVVTDDQMSLERYQPIGSEFDLVDAVGIRFYGDPYASVTFRGNVKFNPITDVDLSADTITPSGDFDPRFTTGTAVRYDVITPRGVGGSAMGGLTDGERLWIRVSGDGITLHPTRTDAIHGTNRKDILDLGTGVNHQLNRGCATKDAAWINPDDIDLETDVFYVLDHGFETGAQMSWGRWDGGSGVPVGIRDSRYKWYLGDFDGHSFALYRSLEDAVNDVNRVKLYTQESGWLNRANQEIPVRTGTYNIHWSGGIIDGGVDTTLDIQDEKDPSGAYCNMSAFLMDAGMTQTVEGVRIMNAWDGLAIYGLPCRFTAPSGCDIVVKDSWFSDISDDAIESDQYGTITVSDVLIERTFACLSMVQGTGPLEDQSATDSINLTNFLCHSRATKRNVEKYGTEFHISSLKLRGEPDNPKWHCTGCVFAFEDYQHPLNNAGWDNMWDNIGTITNSYLLYLSGDTLPTGFPDPTGAPWNATGLTIQTGATAQATWDAARAKFILEHPTLVEN